MTLQEERDQRDTLPCVALVYTGQLEKRPIWARSFRGSSLRSNYERLGGVVSWSHCFQASGETGHMNDRVMERDVDLLATENKRGTKEETWSVNGTKDKTIFQRYFPNDQLPLTRPHLLRAHQPMNSTVG